VAIRYPNSNTQAALQSRDCSRITWLGSGRSRIWRMAFRDCVRGPARPGYEDLIGCVRIPDPAPGRDW